MWETVGASFWQRKHSFPGSFKAYFETLQASLRVPLRGSGVVSESALPSSRVGNL